MNTAPVANSEHKPLRVLYITHYNLFGGGGNLSLWYLMLDLRKRYGVTPSILMPSEGPLSEECRKNNIETFCTKFRMWVESGNSLYRTLRSTARLVLNRCVHNRKIFSLLKDKHFDIIHTASTLPETGLFISEHFSVPHVWHLTEYGPYGYNIHYAMPRWYVRSRFSKSAALIAISGAIRDAFVNVSGLCPAEKTKVIYNGLKVPEPFEKTYTQDGRINFCMVGFVFPTKNQAMAIRACAKLKDITDKFTLHIIGSGDIDGMKSLAESLGVGQNVKFWGSRNDVYDILHDMDVGLTLTNFEGFGRVTVEYMLHYMPVLVSDTGANPEIVLDGETGCICPLGDHEKLAELMHRFIAHPELLRTMGSKGRERAEKCFSLEHNTDETYALYQEILNRR